MKRVGVLVVIAAVTGIGCGGSDDVTDPVPTPPGGVDASPPQDLARCFVNGPGELPPPTTLHAFDPHTFRVTRATGAVTELVGHAVPLGGRASARIEEGRLVVRRGGQIILSTDARGAIDLAWEIERDGVLYLGLFYGDGEQTYQALQLSAAPNIAPLWCETPPNAGLHGIRGGFATAHGPLMIRTNTELQAIRTEDGTVAWRAAWLNAGGPFTLLEAGAQSVVCDRNIAVFDHATGAVAWQHTLPEGNATECAIVGDHVLFATRHCGAQQCVVRESGALTLADGAVEWSSPELRLLSLAALDSDRAVVAYTGGVGLLDASTGALGPTIVLSHQPWAGELLDGGDVLLYGRETTRLGVAPFTVRWQRPYAEVTRDGQALLTTRVDASTSTTWLVEIDVATGTELVREVERRGGSSEVAITKVVGLSPDAVDVVTRFGPLD